jgi:hypothetical protein
MVLYIKFLLIGKLVLLSFFPKDNTPMQKETYTYKRISSYTYKNKPVIVYKTSETGAEIIYKVVLYSDPALKNPKQTLLVRKADDNVKMMMGANFILSEEEQNQYINYPYAWETMNVTMKDLQEDCLNVFSKSVAPLKLN